METLRVSILNFHRTTFRRSNESPANAGGRECPQCLWAIRGMQWWRMPGKLSDDAVNGSSMCTTTSCIKFAVAFYYRVRCGLQLRFGRDVSGQEPSNCQLAATFRNFRCREERYNRCIKTNVNVKQC